MVDIIRLETLNQHRFENMHIAAARLPTLHDRASILCLAGNKARYQGVTDRLAELAAKDPTLYAVPWWFVAIVSEREYGGPPRWDRQLGQGDRLDLRSHNVPAGMGPYLSHPEDKTPGFDAWTRCCVEVLTKSAPYAAKWKLWTPGGVATIFEEYNGLGYASMGVPSAYVWSGSDQYQHGKYVADHVYSASAVDVQEGCMPLLAAMMAVDTTIKFGTIEPAAPVPLHELVAAS